MTEHPNIASALVAALSDLTVVEKGRSVDMTLKSGKHLKYDYADLADVVKITRPLLAEHGIVALTPIHDHGNGLACTVILVHTSGDRMELGPFPFPHGADAQATGSMVTYHRRYSLLAALGMAAGDDDDDGATAVAKQQVVESERRAEGAIPVVSAEYVERFKERCKESGADVAKVVKLVTDGRTEDPAQLLKTEVGRVTAAIEVVAGSPM